MDEKKRIEEIKNGLKKSVYAEAARIKVEYANDEESTGKLSNILDGYVDKIDTIDANNLEELEEELRVLKQANVEVGSVGERDLLVKQYNDYIHNDLDRTIAETVEYTYNLNNHTDDLDDILIRPMENELEELNIKSVRSDVPEIAPDTDELFEIEATTDLGVFEDIVELEEDTLDMSVSSTETVATPEASVPQKEVEVKETTETPKQTKKAKKQSKKQSKKSVIDEDFKDEKGLTAFDYILVVVLIVIFAVLIGLVAKINGVF
ncbi:hypothetical protein RZE82_00780 [Mollicutes bacterium LVI A0039]|nr:hypothetical protein RZE82_00780 [Mollicutes bacterium LVI A0039]